MEEQTLVAKSSRRLVVVDPRVDDYQCLIEPARNHLIRLTLASNGSSALRLAGSYPDALWLVSPHLPDMDGLDLLEMLRSLQSKLKAVVVDNRYDRRRELRALVLQAIQYVCKPVQRSWLEAWQAAPVMVQEPNPSAHDPVRRNGRFRKSPKLGSFS